VPIGIPGGSIKFGVSGVVECALCDCWATSNGIHALLKSSSSIPTSCVTVAEAFDFFAELMSKRQSNEVEDASDRAQRCLKPGKTRVPIGQIGSWECNRGGGGVSPHHVQEVAHGTQSHKTKLSRYDYVSLIEFNNEDRQRHLHLNRERCETDELMPKFSPDIQYVCVTKTHFVHALKLMKDGGRTVFNLDNIGIFKIGSGTCNLLRHAATYWQIISCLVIVCVGSWWLGPRGFVLQH
jgi:hypothetical protein